MAIAPCSSFVDTCERMLHAFRLVGRQAVAGACGSRVHSSPFLRVWRSHVCHRKSSALAKQSDWASVTVFHALHKYYQNIRFKDTPAPAVPSDAALGEVEEQLGCARCCNALAHTWAPGVTP